MGNHFFYFGYMGKQKGTKRTMGGSKMNEINNGRIKKERKKQWG